MQRVNGTIKDGEKLLAQDIEIWLSESIDPRSGLHRWSGSFDLHSGKYIEPGGPYNLILEDGRTGNIIINNVITGSRGEAAHFVGTGPLQ
jgi:hypothetical protein